MAGLTPKQEAFALAYLETGNAAEAYRRAYDVAPDAKDGWLYVEACQMLDNPNIALRLAELQDQAAKLSIFTVHKAAEEFEQVRVAAMAAANHAAANGAITGKVKLFGLEPATKAKFEHTGAGGGPIQTEDVTVERLIAEAQRLGIDPSALGLTQGTEEDN